MRRSLLSRRGLGLTALLVVLVAVFIRLGFWQLDVARSDGLRDALDAIEAQPQVSLTSYLQPHQDFPADGSNRRVVATGHYDGRGQVLVTGHRLGDELGSWVVTPLVVDGSGARLPVLRGFTTATDPAQVPAPSTAPVTVTGTLAPGESPQPRTAGLPDGALPALDLTVLLNRWGGAIYNAVLFERTESPDVSASAQIVRVPTPQPASGLAWRNALYAVQWWIFAVFAVYLWWRMLTEGQTGPTVEREPGQPGEPEPGQPEGPTGAPKNASAATTAPDDAGERS